MVPDVIDVLVYLSSVVSEFCDASSICSNREFVEPQSFFSFSKKRAFYFTSTHEEMRYEGSQVKAAPITRRRMTPRTPMQNSYTSFEREHGSYEDERRGCSARERTIIARTKQVLERSYSLKVRVEELEGLLVPE